MAAIPGSVPITGFIAPTDTADIFATQDEAYNRGGFRTVSSLAVRDAITPDRRMIGMLVRVLSTGKFYTLVGGILNVNWVEETFSGSGAGALMHQGDITLPAHFPTTAAVQVGWLYGVKADVTDNDASKTNTGQSFVAGDLISWDGAQWDDVIVSYAAKDQPYAGILSSSNTKDAIDETALAIAEGRTVLLEAGVPEIAGVRYATYANAVTYILSVDTPDYFKRWVVNASGTINTATITLRPWIYIRGTGPASTLFYSDFTDDNVSGAAEAYHIYNCMLGGVDPNRQIICTDCIIVDLDTTTNSGQLVLYSTKVFDTNPGSDISSISLDIIEGSQVILQKAGTVNMWGSSYLTLNSGVIGTLNCYAGGSQVYLGQDTTIGTCYLFGAELYGYGFALTVDTGWSQMLNTILYQCDVIIDTTTLDTSGLIRGTGVETISTINSGTWNNRGEVYDNTASGLTSKNTQDAIDELAGGATGNYKSDIVPLGLQDGVNTLFTIPAAKQYRSGSLTVYLNGSAYQPVSVVENGPGYTTFNITGDTLPVASVGDVLWISYVEV